MGSGSERFERGLAELAELVKDERRRLADRERLGQTSTSLGEALVQLVEGRRDAGLGEAELSDATHA